MLHHVHFEVAIPNPEEPIDSGGFLIDNKNGKRERNPRLRRAWRLRCERILLSSKVLLKCSSLLSLTAQSSAHGAALSISCVLNLTFAHARML